jgi:sec-independent protein translocase protein TatB
MFHLSPATLVVLAVLALFIFGPDRLPKAAAEAARTLRRVRGAVRGATDGFREELGPEFQDVRLRDLHPKALIQRHLLDEMAEPAAVSVPRPAGPRPRPEGWPAHVPFPSAEEMGLTPEDDPFTSAIPRGKAVVVREDEEEETEAAVGGGGAALVRTREYRRHAGESPAEDGAAHGNVDHG